jgi:hypothetical protein
VLTPGTEAFTVATKKQKADESKKTIAKKMKVAQAKVALVKMAPLKKISIVKVIRPKAKPGPRDMSEIEFTLTKPVGVSKNFCFSDISNSSQSQHDKGCRVMKVVHEHTSRVISFDNLGDSLPEARKASPRGKAAFVSLPPPLITRG